MYRETNKIKFTLGPDKILHTECFPNTVMTLEDGKESTRISAEMVNYQPFPLLCDLTNVIKMSQDCRRHFSGPEHAETFSKCALIVTNPISRIIGNFFLGLNKPLKPTRLFKSKEEGLKWLKQKELIKTTGDL
ncbi:MAG: STAS/SEC14 domain-containing protein [Marivirga sp.]|nr:STAS/SEC14 domain-containing protein [Marivirga sp.]